MVRNTIDLTMLQLNTIDLDHVASCLDHSGGRAVIEKTHPDILHNPNLLTTFDKKIIDNNNYLQ